MFNIKKLFYDGVQEEETDTKKVDEKSTTVMSPLVTGNVNIPAAPPTGNMFATKSNSFGTPTLSIPPEDMSKWQNYFNALLESARKQNTLYDTFLGNIDMISETDANQPLTTKIRLAFGLMKRNGVTKDQLITAATNALNGVVNDKVSVFDEKTKLKTKEGVDDKVSQINQKQDSISQKQLEIKKLNEDIAQLESEINTNKNNLLIRSSCYDNLSVQLVSKVKDDITNITNYII